MAKIQEVIILPMIMGEFKKIKQVCRMIGTSSRGIIMTGNKDL